MPVARAIYDENTHKTPDYFSTMDIDVENIDKNYKNTWRSIYEAIDAPCFLEVKLFPKAFLDKSKKHPNETQNIPSETKQNIKRLP